MKMINKLPVLYEDSQCAVFDKPAGLAVQGGAGIGRSLDTLLAEQWARKPFLVHRLDKDTSGLILVAKTREAARYYTGLMADRNARKNYLALCAGEPPEKGGTIALDLVIRGVRKKSRTQYRLVSSWDGLSLLELELDTGRMHQIRRHLAALGLPILGDDKYGDFGLNKRLKKERGLKKLLLHASRLRITGTQGSIDVKAPLPVYFSPFLGPESDG